MESRDPRLLSQHTDPANRLQDRPAHRCLHAYGAVQSETDASLPWTGAFSFLFCVSLTTCLLSASDTFSNLSFSLQGCSLAKQLGAEAYLECSAFTSEKSIHSVFRAAALACMNKLQPANKPSPVRRLSKRLLHLPSKTVLLSSTFSKDKSKSCTIMWILLKETGARTSELQMVELCCRFLQSFSLLCSILPKLPVIHIK